MKVFKETFSTIYLAWPLLVGMLIIMIGSGLQGTLLSLRAGVEGFPVFVIGMVMSLYYCGYFAGWYIVPNMIRTVGYIRVFAGFASLASTTILLQGLFVDPYSWSVVRILSGLSFVGLFIVAEGWLNDIATNEMRGRILSQYIFVTYAGLFIGQFLINLAPVENISLFILVSVLISMSIIPITLANKASPGFEETEHLPLMKLIKTSPYAVASVSLSGFVGAAVLAMGPVYAKGINFNISQVSVFMALYILGSAIIPLITGWFSDKVDRRKMIIFIALLGFISAIITTLFPKAVLIGIFLIGGCGLSVYSIGAALMNDRLKPSQRTSATASLILLSGVSACISPIIIGFSMQFAGPHIFFPVFSCTFLMLFAFGVHRSYVGPEINIDDQVDYQTLPKRGTPEIVQLSEDAPES